MSLERRSWVIPPMPNQCAPLYRRTQCTRRRGTRRRGTRRREGRGRRTDNTEPHRYPTSRLRKDKTMPQIADYVPIVDDTTAARGVLSYVVRPTSSNTAGPQLPHHADGTEIASDVMIENRHAERSTRSWPAPTSKRASTCSLLLRHSAGVSPPGEDWWPERALQLKQRRGCFHDKFWCSLK